MIKNKQSKQEWIFDIKQGKYINPIQEQIRNQKPKGIIYTRVSTEEQMKHGYGIESQENACRIYAQQNGIEIVHVFKDEGISGTVANRKGLNDAIQYLQDINKQFQKISYFICSEISRISRHFDLLTTYKLESRIKTTGVQILTIDSALSTQNDEAYEFRQDIKRIKAKEDIKEMKRRTINGMKTRLMKGYWVFGSYPLGYKKNPKDRDSKEKIPIKDYPNATILKKALEKYASGEIISKQYLYLYLEEQGLKTNSYNNKTGKLYLSVIDRILDTRKLLFYAGYIVYPKRDITDPIKGQHKALIDLDTAYTIINKLSNKKDNPKKINIRNDFNEQLFLRGILYCPDCGRQYTGGMCRSHTGKKYPYYRCTNKSCPNLSKSYTSAQKAHYDLKEYLEQITIDEKIIDSFEYVFEQAWESNKKTNKVETERKQTRLKEIINQQQKIESKMLDIEDDVIFKRFESKWKELDNEKKIIQEEVNTGEYTKENYIKIFNQTKHLFKNPAKIFEEKDARLKKLLIGVQSNEKLIYKKTQGYGTPENCILNLLFSTFAPLKS